MQVPIKRSKSVQNSDLLAGIGCVCQVTLLHYFSSLQGGYIYYGHRFHFVFSCLLLLVNNQMPSNRGRFSLLAGSLKLLLCLSTPQNVMVVQPCHVHLHRNALVAQEFQVFLRRFLYGRKKNERRKSGAIKLKEKKCRHAEGRGGRDCHSSCCAVILVLAVFLLYVPLSQNVCIGNIAP